MSIITREIKEACSCKRCKGTGKDKNGKCSLCGGTGIYKECYSYFINDEKGIAFSGEPGQ